VPKLIVQAVDWGIRALSGYLSRESLLWESGSVLVTGVLIICRKKLGNTCGEPLSFVVHRQAQWI